MEMDSGGQSQVFYIALAVGALFVAVMLPRLRRRNSPPPPPPGSFDPRAGDARAGLEQLLAEIQELSREQIARLDTRIRTLNQLLLDCDRKKLEIEALIGKTSGPGPPPAPPPKPGNPLHAEVYSLHDSGKDLDAICSATGLEKGEVALFLGLRGMPPADR